MTQTRASKSIPDSAKTRRNRLVSNNDIEPLLLVKNTNRPLRRFSRPLAISTQTQSCPGEYLNEVPGHRSSGSFFGSPKAFNLEFTGCRKPAEATSHDDDAGQRVWVG
jgi:hypothetical protein